MLWALLSQYSAWLLLVIGTVLLLCLILFVVRYHKAKTAPFLLWRQEAAGQARWLLGLIILLAATAIVIYWQMGLSPLTNPLAHLMSNSALDSEASPTSDATPDSRREGESPSSQVHSGTTTPPSPPARVATPTASPTTAPDSTATPSPPSQAIEPSLEEPEASLETITVALGVSQDRQPLNPGSRFPPMQGPIYVFFSYSHMSDGVEWIHVWLKDGEEIARNVGTWEWGRFGRAYIFLSPSGGYEPGQYTVQLFVEEELMQEIRFTIEK